MEWESELQNDRDSSFLLDGIKNGFRLSEPNSVFESVHQKNHPSAFRYKQEVEKELVNQVKLGHYVLTKNKPSIVSGLAAIPKDDGSVSVV